VSVTTLPTKTTYVQGQPLNAAGGKMTVTYSDGTSAALDLSAAVLTYPQDQTGSVTATATYIGQTASFAITVNERQISSIGLTEPTKVSYLEGQDLNLTGGYITVVFVSDDSYSEKVPLTASMVTGYDKNTIGTQTLTVTYGGQTKTFAVIVNAKSLTGIEVTTKPTKTTYLEAKDVLDVTGGRLTLTYNNGTTAVIDMTASMVTGFDNTKVGNQTLTVTYGGKFCTYEAKVCTARPVVTARAVGSGSAMLTWSAIPEASKYAVAYQNADGSWTTLTLDCTGTSYTATGLTNGQTYTFLVQSYTDGWSSFSSADYMQVKPVDCTRPVVTATAGDGSVSLSWNAIPGASKYAVAYQNDDGSWNTLTTSCTDTGYTARNLIAGKTYTFLIQSYTDRWSSFDSTDYAKAVPTGTRVPAVTASAVGNGSATLTWGAISGASKYAVAYQNADGSWTTLTLSCTGTSYTATGLTNGQAYTFLVQSYTDGWSNFSSTDYVHVTPVDPNRPAVTATAGTGSATLTWGAISGASKYAVAYQNADGSWTTLTLSCTGTSYTATNLIAGKTYTFLVQASVGGSWSSFGSADFVKATPGGTRKPAVTVSTVENGSVIFTWGAISGASRYAVAYQNTDSSWTTLTLNCTGTSYTATGLTSGQTYTFLVQAYTDGWSSFDSTDYVQVMPVNANRPVVKATAGTGNAALTWDAIPGASKYAVAYQNTDGSWTTLTMDCTGTSYTATGLTNGQTYTFLVQSYTDGWSSFSSADYVHVTPNGARKPAAAANGVGDGCVILDWGAISGATRYAIAYLNEDGSWTTLTMDCTETRYTATGLENGRKYTFVVQAYTDGWSDFSSADYVTATPRESNWLGVIACAGSGSALLSWGGIPGVERYAIAYLNEDGSWTTLTKDCTTTNYKAAGLISGKTYTFLVQAYVNGHWSSFDSTDYVTVTPR